MKASKLVKSCMFGLVAAAGTGFISLPAKADEIIQDGHQTTVQDGAYNTSAEQLDQNAEVKDSKTFHSEHQLNDSITIAGKKSNRGQGRV